MGAGESNTERPLAKKRANCKNTPKGISANIFLLLKFMKGEETWKVKGNRRSNLEGTKILVLLRRCRRITNKRKNLKLSTPAW